MSTIGQFGYHAGITMDPQSECQQIIGKTVARVKHFTIEFTDGSAFEVITDHLAAFYPEKRRYLMPYLVGVNKNCGRKIYAVDEKYAEKAIKYMQFINFDCGYNTYEIQQPTMVILNLNAYELSLLSIYDSSGIACDFLNNRSTNETLLDYLCRNKLD